MAKQIIATVVSFLVILSFACSSPPNPAKDFAIGKWVNRSQETTYYEFFADRSLKIHVTEHGLNKKFYPKGEEKKVFMGKWKRVDEHKLILEFNMYEVTYKCDANIYGDTMSVKLWEGGTERLQKEKEP